MIRMIFAIICLVTAIAVWVTKSGLFGFAWYLEAIALAGVAAILLWTVWLDWREEALWGKKKTDLSSVDTTNVGSNIDLFPDD